MKRAVFLDRDGTIVHDRHFLRDPEELELLPDAADSMRRLAVEGFELVVVTNQSGVGRAYFTAEELAAQHVRLRELLDAEGVRLAGIFACPHGPDDGCDCRKPEPGLIFRAARELEIDLASSFAIGDQPRDAEAARRAGVVAFTLPIREAAEVILQRVSNSDASSRSNASSTSSESRGSIT